MLIKLRILKFLYSFLSRKDENEGTLMSNILQ